MLKAAVNLNRFAIVYELAKEFVDKAVNRFGLKTLYEEAQNVCDVYVADNNGQLSFAV